MLLVWTGLKLKIFFQKFPYRCEQSTKHCGKLTVLTHLFCVVFLAIVQGRDNTYSAASAAIRHTSTLYQSVSSFWSTFHERHWQFALNLLFFCKCYTCFKCGYVSLWNNRQIWLCVPSLFLLFEAAGLGNFVAMKSQTGKS